MNFDLDSIYSNEVWNLVDVPKGIVLISCKWIFKKNVSCKGIGLIKISTIFSLGVNVESYHQSLSHPVIGSLFELPKSLFTSNTRDLGFFFLIKYFIINQRKILNSYVNRLLSYLFERF